MKTATIVVFTWLTTERREWERRREYRRFARIEGKYFEYDVEIFASQRIVVPTTESKCMPYGTIHKTFDGFPVAECGINDAIERVHNGIDLLATKDEARKQQVNKSYRWMAKKYNHPIIETEMEKQQKAMINMLDMMLGLTPKPH